MKNKTKYPLEEVLALVKTGKVIDLIAIDPKRDKDKQFELPYKLPGERLFAWSDTGPGQDERIDEISTPAQYEKFITAVKECAFGYYLGDPDVVFTTIVKVAA